MRNVNVSIEIVSETSILIKFSDHIDAELSLFIHQVAELIGERHADSIMNLTPSYTTLLIDYLPYRISEHTMRLSLFDLIQQIDKQPNLPPIKTVKLPIYYGFDVAPDLQNMLIHKSLDLETFIKKHTTPEYTICAIGFSPGFAFLSGLDTRLATKRHATPRLQVMAGSVGIADNQTAVYPSSTPGGWNIIGNCPIKIFDPSNAQLSPFRVGDKVKFDAITKDKFIQLGGTLWAI